QQVQLGQRLERRKQGFGNRRLLDCNSSFPGELSEFALRCGQFVRLQPPRAQEGYSYGCWGGFTTVRDNAKKQDNDEGQSSLQWTMRQSADVHEDVPGTIAISGSV